jgi:hypothetical protein
MLSVPFLLLLLTSYDLRLVAKPQRVPMYLNIGMSAVAGSLSSLMASERFNTCAAERLGTNYALLLGFPIAHSFFVSSTNQSHNRYA